MTPDTTSTTDRPETREPSPPEEAGDSKPSRPDAGDSRDEAAAAPSPGVPPRFSVPSAPVATAGPTAHRPAPERPSWGEPTRPVAEAAPAQAPADRPVSAPEPARAAPERPTEGSPTVRLTPTPAPGVRRLVVSDLTVGSVFRLALGLYLAVFGVVLAAGVGLWLLLSASGVVGQIEGFLGELLGYEDYEFLGWRILQYFVLVGLLWVTVAAGATALLALLYNRVSRIVGGVEVRVEEQ